MGTRVKEKGVKVGSQLVILGMKHSLGPDFLQTGSLHLLKDRTGVRHVLLHFLHSRLDLILLLLSTPASPYQPLDGYKNRLPLQIYLGFGWRQKEARLGFQASLCPSTAPESPTIAPGMGGSIQRNVV